MKYHFKKMLQHNTLNTQCLFKNICVKKIKSQESQERKKKPQKHMIIVN